MKKFLSLALLSLMAMCAWAVEKTDEIPGSLTLIIDYSQQVLECESGSAWLVTLKDEGDGPQFKTGKGGIVTKTSIGMVKKVMVEWGAKSNGDLVVYGSHTAIADPKAQTGELLGTIAFAANTTGTLEIEGDWEYIGIDSQSSTGKATKFNKVQVVWETSGEEQGPDPQQGLVINEVCGNDGTTEGCEDWVEIANATDKAISLAGVQLVLVDDVDVVLKAFADDEVLAPGAYAVAKKGIDFEKGISNSKNIIVKLVSANGNALDRFNKQATLTDNGHHKAGGSYSRVPDMTGEWAAVQNATPGAANDATPIAAEMKTFQKVTTSEGLVDGMTFILVNENDNNAFAMSSSWATTKEGGVYQLAETVELLDCNIPSLHADVNRVAVCTLEDAGNGKWGIHFGETNNYMNDGLYLACTAFKALDFKKAIDKKGVACEITFNEGGDAEINYGELAGSLKFNYKGDGTDRFLNYDPTDKPDEHQGVYIFKAVQDIPNAITTAESAKTRTNMYYNLNGQRVVAPTKGLYIKDGKKVVVK